MRLHDTVLLARALKNACQRRTPVLGGSMSRSHALVISIVFTGFVSSLNAATFVVPADRDLIRRADAIVIGSPLTSYSQLTAEGGIETVTSFSVSEVIGGMNVAGAIDIVEPGGTYGGK